MRRLISIAPGSCALLCGLAFILAFGGLILAQQNPLCYQETSASAAAMGCPVPPTVNPICKGWLECGPGNTTNCPTGSGFHRPRRVRTGTYIWNSGLSAMTVGADICYDWVPCYCDTVTGLCVVDLKASRPDPASTWQAQHATGLPCPP